jgi:hypothetical protein
MADVDAFMDELEAEQAQKNNEAEGEEEGTPAAAQDTEAAVTAE